MHDKLGDQTENLSIKSSDITKGRINLAAIIFFTTLALVVIFNLFGLLPWGVWLVLLRLWPIYLVMVLLQMFGKKYPAAATVATAIGLGIVISLILFSMSGVSERADAFLTNYSPQLIKIRKFLGLDLGQRLSSQMKIHKDDHPGIESRVVNLTIQTGSINLTDYADPNHIIIQANYYEKFGRPELNSLVMDKKLNISLSTQKSVLPVLGGGEDVRYDISLGETQMPTDLYLDVGAASFYAFFRNINLKDAEFSVGTGKAYVLFNENTRPKQKLNIRVGAGSMRMVLPYGTFAKINYKIGFGNLQINNLSFKRDGSYTTRNYRIDSEPLEINVNIGAGTVYIDASGS